MPDQSNSHTPPHQHADPADPNAARMAPGRESAAPEGRGARAPYARRIDCTAGAEERPRPAAQDGHGRHR